MDNVQPLVARLRVTERAEFAGLSRRQLLGAGAGLAGGLLVAACGGSLNSPASGGKSSGATTTGALARLPGGTPKRGGTLTVGVISGGQEENLFPGTSVGTPDFVRDYNLYNLLFYLGKDVTPLVPGLALSAESNADASMWVFKLREGV